MADSTIWSANDEDTDGVDGDEVISQKESENRNETSRPYILVCKNETDHTIDNVEFLNANERIFNHEREGLLYSYGTPSITYGQFLTSVTSGLVFITGLTRIIVENDIKNVKESNKMINTQIGQQVLITTRDIAGNFVARPAIPVFDSYGYQLSQVDMLCDYIVNGMTSLTIARILPHTTVKLHLFLSSGVRNGLQRNQIDLRQNLSDIWRNNNPSSVRENDVTDVKTILKKQQALSNKELDKHLKNF